MIKASSQQLPEPQSQEHEDGAEPIDCIAAPHFHYPHQMLRVCSSVRLQKPVPLTPSLGRAYE